MENDADRAPRAQDLSEELNRPADGTEATPQAGSTASRWRALLVTAGRTASFAVLVPPRAGARLWTGLRPAQQLVIGFGLYVMAGTLALSLPWSQRARTGFLDHLFNATSAVSTTGLMTVSLPERYTPVGAGVLLVLFQLGGVGFMTLSSVVMLARGRALSPARLDVLRAGFAVPKYFVLQHFLVHVVVFTAVCEGAGTLVLWWRFSVIGDETPLWSAVFHSVSAFATAGFSLHADSLERYAHDPVVNITIGSLCFLGAIGFIVAQDVWYSIKLRERMLTFTSKVILTMTAGVFVFGGAAFFLLDPGVRALPFGERVLASAFQVVSASTTAGFNTVPIGALSQGAIVVLLIAMLIGASPSGTGGGMKTTTVSAILGNLVSVLRSRQVVQWMGREIPMVRVLAAFAASSLYLVGLCAGVLVLCVTDASKPFLPLVFEASSALGTVGLSMGITGDMSAPGKWVLIVLMFAGRCGPLTIGLALLRPEEPAEGARRDDLAV